MYETFVPVSLILIPHPFVIFSISRRKLASKSRGAVSHVNYNHRRQSMEVWLLTP